MEEGPPEGAHIEEQVATRKGEQRTKAPLPNGGTDTSQAPLGQRSTTATPGCYHNPAPKWAEKRGSMQPW